MIYFFDRIGYLAKNSRVGELYDSGVATLQEMRVMSAQLLSELDGLRVAALIEEAAESDMDILIAIGELRERLCDIFGRIDQQAQQSTDDDRDARLIQMDLQQSLLWIMGEMSEIATTLRLSHLYAGDIPSLTSGDTQKYPVEVTLAAMPVFGNGKGFLDLDKGSVVSISQTDGVVLIEKDGKFYGVTAKNFPHLGLMISSDVGVGAG